MNLRWIQLLTMAILLMMTTACSTEKAKWANVQFHNTTCHYNVWWNGNESLKLGVEKLHTSVVDDYTTFLPAEKLGNADNARSIYPEMDRAIEKGVKGIKEHSIYIKGEEHVPYIKECYLLTAYATFYKQDYISTNNTCNILLTQFAGTRAADEGGILLARCMTGEKRYAEAEAALDQLVANYSKGNFAKSQVGKLYVAMVEATVPQGKFKKAVEYIHLAINSNIDRSTKARLTFLMAQIYQKLDKRAVAAKYYHQVLGYGPEYVMEFNAKLGEASCADLQHADIKRLERQLDDLLDDHKNTEYRDQIYYAKGEMYMGLKDAKRACDNFRLSVANATTNKAQKARSALRLAQILYDVYEDYDQSQLYYDTVMQNIAKDYPGYTRIRQRHDVLTELVSYTRTTARCDSLLLVAAMPEEQRLSFIRAKIDTLIKHEEEAKERALLEEAQAETRAMQNTLSGDWYFYNPNTVQKGKETFRQRWGVRALEDYWFLANHTSMSMDLFADEPADESPTTDSLLVDSATTSTPQNPLSGFGNPSDPHDVAFYLKDIPRTQHAFDSIDSLTSLCLLNAGYLYYDGVGNIPRALECYLRLSNDYTSHPEIVQAFYMLYRIYDKQGNTPQANYYRDMVLMGFPDSDFANLIRDNEYYKELLRRDARIEEDYEQIYTLYTQRRYTSVIAKADQVAELYAGNPAIHRFNYWKGLALARRGDYSDAIQAFQTILDHTSERDSINPLAAAQIERLMNDSTTLAQTQNETITEKDEQRIQQTDAPLPSATPTEADEDELPAASQIYRYRPNQQYYVIIVANDKRIKATELQYRISDFNGDYYANSGYKVDALLFTDSTQLITIHRFMSEQEAMDYYQHLQQTESPLRQYPPSDHLEFVISTQNYATFYNRRDPAAYLPFFEKYYLKPKK